MVHAHNTGSRDVQRLLIVSWHDTAISEMYRKVQRVRKQPVHNAVRNPRPAWRHVRPCHLPLHLPSGTHRLSSQRSLSCLPGKCSPWSRMGSLSWKSAHRNMKENKANLAKHIAKWPPDLVKYLVNPKQNAHTIEHIPEQARNIPSGGTELQEDGRLQPRCTGSSGRHSFRWGGTEGSRTGTKGTGKMRLTIIRRLHKRLPIYRSTNTMKWKAASTPTACWIGSHLFLNNDSLHDDLLNTLQWGLAVQMFEH